MSLANNMAMALDPAAALASVRRQATMAGGIGVVLLGVGFFINRGQFFPSYLQAYVYCLAIPLGCFAITMLHNMVGGNWGWSIRPFLQAGMRMLPFMALLFLPVLLGLSQLYSWAHPGAAAHDALIAAKEKYLNVPFFLKRVAFYFALWVGWSLVLNKLLLPKSEWANLPKLHRLQRWSALGLVLYVLSASFASIDWVMSIEPKWFSSIFGGIFIIGNGMSTFAFLLIVAIYFHKRFQNPYMVDKGMHDLSKLLFMTVMVWAYFNLSQYLIIWCGNLPEETFWYSMRGHGHWTSWSTLMVAGIFIFPFLAMLPRSIKKSTQWMPLIALWLLTFRFIEQVWLIGPTFKGDGFPVGISDIVVWLGLVAVSVCLFFFLVRPEDIPYQAGHKEPVKHPIPGGPQDRPQTAQKREGH